MPGHYKKMIRASQSERAYYCSHIIKRNIVGRNMLRTFGHHVGCFKATWCACPGTPLLQEPGQTSTTSYNIPKNSIKNRTIFKLDPTTPSYNTQHILTTPTLLYNVATGWPSERNMLRPTRLRYVALAGG